MGSLLPWFSERKTEVKYPSTPAVVAIREQDTVTTRVSLQEFVEKRCPSLHSKFHPAWWLPR